MKARAFVLLTCVVVVLAGLVLVAGEGFIRHRERSRTVPGTMPLLYYRHARLHHALVRDFSYFRWARVDTAGFRWTDDGRRPGGGRPVILVLGSSTTFDTEVSGDLKAWPARLEAWLREQPSGVAGAVLNGGVSGYRVVDQLVRLETDLADFHPDLILLYEAHNDLFATLAGSASQERHRPGRTPTFAPWTAWLEAHSLLYGKVMGRLKVMRFRGARGGHGARGPAVWDSLIQAGAERFERDLESLVAVAGARGIPIVLMTVTHVSSGDSLPSSEEVTRNWANTLPGVPPVTVLKTYRAINARIAAVAQRHGIAFIDGAASGVVGLDLYAEGDPVHFNDVGADRFARFVARELVRPRPDTTRGASHARPEPRLQ